jgi:hypothetical protein
MDLQVYLDQLDNGMPRREEPSQLMVRRTHLTLATARRFQRAMASDPTPVRVFSRVVLGISRQRGVRLTDERDSWIILVATLHAHVQVLELVLSCPKVDVAWIRRYTDCFNTPTLSMQGHLNLLIPYTRVDIGILLPCLRHSHCSSYTLSLCICGLVEHKEELKEVIAQNKHLRVLSFSASSRQDESMEIFFEALSASPSLESLAVGSHSPDIIKYLAKLIPRLSRLRAITAPWPAFGEPGFLRSWTKEISAKMSQAFTEAVCQSDTLCSWQSQTALPEVVQHHLTRNTWRAKVKGLQPLAPNLLPKVLAQLVTTPDRPRNGVAYELLHSHFVGNA